MQIRQWICQKSHAQMFNVVLCYTANIHKVHAMVMNNILVDPLSESNYVIWDECGEQLEAMKLGQDSKNR